MLSLCQLTLYYSQKQVCTFFPINALNGPLYMYPRQTLKFNVVLRPQRPQGLLGTGSPGWLPQLSHSSWTLSPTVILGLITIIMYIYHVFIDALSDHMIHILNTILYTHVEHSPTKTICIKYYMLGKKLKQNQKTHHWIQTLYEKEEETKPKKNLNSNTNNTDLYVQVHTERKVWKFYVNSVTLN